jgi:hypothetical protein
MAGEGSLGHCTCECHHSQAAVLQLGSAQQQQDVANNIQNAANRMQKDVTNSMQIKVSISNMMQLVYMRRTRLQYQHAASSLQDGHFSSQMVHIA